MSWVVGDVLRGLIPLFSTYDLGTVQTRDDIGTGDFTGGYSITDGVFLRQQDDDFWNGATMLVLNGVNGWVLDQVGNYIGATNTLEFNAVLGQEEAAVGDEFLLFKSGFSLGQFIGAVNASLRMMMVMQEDISLAVVDDQVEYTLPEGVSDVRVVELLNESGEFVCEFQHWEELNGKLRFSTYLPSTGTASTLRLKYAGQHPFVSDVEDEIIVHPERLLWEAAAQLMLKQSKSGHQDRKVDVFWAGIEKNLLKARVKYRNHLAVKIKSYDA